ncbi:MAG: metalloregulator ArsR/SmtB family transcription factor [Anaerolineales bacterium]|nr:metalloregulator ArsR/SmtB family transcription factor [Anaerolineales bacterium]
MNIKKFARKTSDLFSVLGNDFRIQLLYAIGKGEICVCHMEEVLQKRQPYISQHLSVLRESGLLQTRRDGKYVYYRLKDSALFELIKAAAELQEFSVKEMPVISSPGVKNDCTCPTCEIEEKTESSSTIIKEIS